MSQAIGLRRSRSSFKSSLETQTEKVEPPSQQNIQPSNAQWYDHSGTSSSNGATHMYVLSTLLRTVCTTYSIYSSSFCGLNLSSQLRCGSSQHRILPEFFYKQTKQNQSCRQLSRFLWVPHPYTHTPSPAPSRITILHLLAATTDGPPEAFPGQEYQVDRDRRYDDVSSCRRTYGQKECGDNGCRGRYDFSRKFSTRNRLVF